MASGMLIKYYKNENKNIYLYILDVSKIISWSNIIEMNLYISIYIYDIIYKKLDWCYMLYMIFIYSKLEWYYMLSYIHV